MDVRYETFCSVLREAADNVREELVDEVETYEAGDRVLFVDSTLSEYDLEVVNQAASCFLAGYLLTCTNDVDWKLLAQVQTRQAELPVEIYPHASGALLLPQERFFLDSLRPLLEGAPLYRELRDDEKYRVAQQIIESSDASALLDFIEEVWGKEAHEVMVVVEHGKYGGVVSTVHVYNSQGVEFLPDLSLTTGSNS